MAGINSNLLLGIANGFTQYQLHKEDNNYLQQVKSAELDKLRLTNDSIGLKNQAIQSAVQQQKTEQDFMAKAFQYAKEKSVDESNPKESYSDVDTTSFPSTSKPISYTNETGQSNDAAYSLKNLSSIDKQKGLPTGTLAALAQTESSGNVNAVGPKLANGESAIGPFQVRPSTAKDPGFGVSPGDARDPNFAGDYFSMLYKKAGGNVDRALEMWNAGPGGNPDNPETKAFKERFKRNLDRVSKTSDPEVRTPATNAADNLAAADGKVPSQVRSAAVKQQKTVADTLDKMAEYSMMSGQVSLAETLQEKAQKARAIEVQQRQVQLKERKESVDQVGTMVSTVSNQDEWSSTLQTIRSDPLMRQNLQGLNITGDFDRDQKAIQSLKMRTMTVKEQEELKLKKDSGEIKAIQSQLKADKLDAEKARNDAFEDAELRRIEGARAAGIPVEPTPTAIQDPKTRANTMRAIQTANLKDQAQDNASSVASRRGLEIANRLDSLLKGGLRTGPVLGRTTAKLSDEGQEFEKLGNDLVLMMQDTRSGVSSKTAAMFKNISAAKPELIKNPEANRIIVDKIRAAFVEDQNRIQFKNEFSKYNTSRLDADKWYDDYSAKYPLYIPDPTSPTGEYKLDTRRPTWQQYFKR